MAVPKSSPTPKPAVDPSQDAATKMSAVLNEIKRGNLNQENNMKKLMDTMKKDIILAGLGPVLKILDVINKLIALLIMPFTNLIIPLLLPILYFLSPIVRFLNIALRPLFVQLMEWAKNQKGKVTAAVEQMKGGDITGAISSMVAVMTEGIQMLMTGIQPYLDAMLKAINFDGLIAMAQEKLAGIWAGIKEALDDATGGITEWLENAELDKHFNNIIEGIGTILGGIWDQFTQWGNNILSNMLTTTVVPGFANIVQAIDKWGKSFYDRVAEFFDKDVDAAIHKWTGNTFWPAFEQLKTQIATSLTEMGATIASSIASAITSAANNHMRVGAENLMAMPDIIGNELGFHDFIQRPGQPATSFSSDDTIVGFKGASPFGGGNQNITIRLVDSMNNTISSQRLQAGSGANMTFTV